MIRTEVWTILSVHPEPSHKHVYWLSVYVLRTLYLLFYCCIVVCVVLSGGRYATLSRTFSLLIIILRKLSS